MFTSNLTELKPFCFALFHFMLVITKCKKKEVLVLRTHQLHIVDSLFLKMCQCFSSIFMNGESHSLQSLLLGVHTDVRLDLNTTQ